MSLVNSQLEKWYALHKGLFVDYSVTNARNARAEEASTVLKYYSNHDIDGGRLLDIGCGNGSTTQWFSQHVNTYTVGIEIKPAWDRISRHGNTKMEFLSASGIKLPFKSKSFHTIILNDVLEHVSYRQAKELFVEIGRVLDDEGQVYVSVANKFQIREPHSNLLFVSWLPRWIYAPIVRNSFEMTFAHTQMTDSETLLPKQTSRAKASHGFTFLEKFKMSITWATPCLDLRYKS